ncbi:MAG: uncharacterized protein JWO18_2948 [Microbacteriaceae bacterium]|nr:uncharacterized protein [Microbacteriaceae bacterium]
MRARIDGGYELHPIQRQAAIATPSRWRDALVVSAEADGAIEVFDIESESTRNLWHFADLTGFVSAGEPVSLHADYDVLAIGDAYFSVFVSR